MGNKAVLNITKFSLGDSTSMAALLLPTTKPNQDMVDYQVAEDLLVDDAVTEFCKGYSGNGTPSANAVFRFLNIIDPSFLDGEFTDAADLESKLSNYSNQCRVYEFYSLVNGWLLAVSQAAIMAYDCNPRGLAIDHLKEKVSEQQEFDASSPEFSGILTFYANCRTQLLAHAVFNEGDCPDETLDSFVELAQSMHDTFTAGTDAFPGFDQMRETKRGTEKKFQEFYQLVSCLNNRFTKWEVHRNGEGVSDRVVGPQYDSQTGMWSLQDPGSTDPEQSPYSGTVAGNEKARSLSWDADDGVKYTASRNYEFLSGAKRAFDTLKLRANGVLLKQYVDTAVEYPYFLDLSLEDVTQTDEASDANGSTMHTVEREVFKGDEWQSNHQKGDRLRIRDMFRVDKLNKVSAYESFVLSPGHYGLQKDLELEQEDMVSRLMQNEMTAYGVNGMASTSAGLYLLTEPDDSSSSTSKGTIFSNGIGVYDTGTFKSFVTPLDAAENYLGVSHISPRVGLLRHFGGESPTYSSGSDFLSWYSSYVDSVVCKRGEVQGKSSLLRIIANNSYEWFPSKLGVRYLHEVYGQAEYDGDEFMEVSRKLPSGGLSVIASIGDDNYEQSVPRCFDIEIPCDIHSQYSYLTFGCELLVDSDISTGGREVSIEFSLDDDAPIRFFLLNTDKRPENISDTNPLYESVKEYDPQLNKPKLLNPPKSAVNGEVDSQNEFKFIIENNLATGASRVFHISIAADFPALRDIVSSEDMKKAYANTFVRISTPALPMQNKPRQTTYGDYHAFKVNKGESIDDFWNLSATMDKASHQHILEIPHNIRMANNSVVVSNYTTASLFSDVLTAKNHMDSEYRMQVSNSNDNFLLDRFRHYTGIDSCSDTISLYYDADTHSIAKMSKDNSDENLAQEYDIESEVARDREEVDPQIGVLKYKRIETIKAVNRFQHDMKHKSNLFSVRVRNSMTNEMLAEAHAKYKNSGKTEADELELMETERAVKNVRTLITNAIEKICLDYAPAHNQLFKVYFD